LSVIDTPLSRFIAVFLTATLRRRSFAHQQNNLKRELNDLIKVTDSEFCKNVEQKEKEEIVNEVDLQFKEVMEKHKRRPAKWYNDDGRYRSAVIEMLNMKENAMAVPKLSMVMYGEWKNKQKFLRQANRMVSKDRSRYESDGCKLWLQLPQILSQHFLLPPLACFPN
jgi:hypothetical protein